jgi:FkbM family methyltransferase
VRTFLKRLLRRWLSPPARRDVAVGHLVLSARRPGAAGAHIARWAPDWKTELVKEFLSCRPGLFLDVGANVGQTMLDYLASGTGGGYIGFEPNPRAAEYILDLIDHNGLSDCSVVPAALSDRNGIATFYMQVRGTVDRAATLVADLRPNRAVQAEHVSCHRFDDISASLLGGRPVSLVKVDVEGAELPALRGMEKLLRTGPWLICEVNGRDPNADAAAYRAEIGELKAFLNETGYVPFRVEKTEGYRKVGGFVRIDAFPDTILTPENHHGFDYVFIPDRHQEQLLALL